jgi:carbonic anhydrase
MPTTTNIAALLERNVAFAATDARRNVPPIPFIPRQHSFVITCIDPRTDPAAFLGVELGDAVVLRNVGGRVTPAVIQDVAYISYLVETKAPEGPWFEVAVIHHTNCGSGFLADDALRRGFAARAGYDEEALAALPVLDPAKTVQADAERLLAAPQVSPRITVSGHVYDVETGLVTTVAAPASPEPR